MFGLEKNIKIDPRDFLDDHIINSLLNRFPLGSTDVSKIIHRILGFLKNKEQV